MSDEFPLQSGWVLCWSFKGSQLRWLGNLLVCPWMPPWWTYSREVPPKKALKKTKDEAWPWFTKESLWVPPDTSGSFLWFGRSVHICSSFNLAPNKRKKMDGLFYSKTASSCTSLRNGRVLKKVPQEPRCWCHFTLINTLKVYRISPSRSTLSDPFVWVESYQQPSFPSSCQPPLINIVGLCSNADACRGIWVYSDTEACPGVLCPDRRCVFGLAVSPSDGCSVETYLDFELCPSHRSLLAPCLTSP